MQNSKDSAPCLLKLSLCISQAFSLIFEIWYGMIALGHHLSYHQSETFSCHEYQKKNSVTVNVKINSTSCWPLVSMTMLLSNTDLSVSFIFLRCLWFFLNTFPSGVLTINDLGCSCFLWTIAGYQDSPFCVLILSPGCISVKSFVCLS